MCGILASTDKTISMDLFQKGLKELVDRGPDAGRIKEVEDGILGFQRLAIMGLSDEGMQPFELNGSWLICNGELYGFRPLKKELEKKYTFHSDSDCELLLPLYEEYGCDMFKKLDSEFALVLYSPKDGWIAARDPIGIRPLFYGFTENGKICFGSTVKSLLPFCKDIAPFPPGTYYKDGVFTTYHAIDHVDQILHIDEEEACRRIHDELSEGVLKRLDADAPTGCLLSGGLDSSLVCAIAQKHTDHPIRTFAIGMEKDAIDLKYARMVADYIGSDHTEYYMSTEDVLAAVPEVIKVLGTWDITTIRASIGMYLLCKQIHENTDVKVLLTGEVSDELFGYKYTDYAPDAQSFQSEEEKRMRELYLYDVLRADRCISSCSMEGRVPFGDLRFVQTVLDLDPAMKMNNHNCGKYLLRHAFEKDHLLPECILFREKAAFSDAVGHSMVDDLKAHAEMLYTDEDLENAKKKYSWCTPFTKESLWYRDLFEQFYPGMGHLIKDFWMPNRTWPHCNVNDPSARVLENYGASAY